MDSRLNVGNTAEREAAAFDLGVRLARADRSYYQTERIVEQPTDLRTLFAQHHAARRRRNLRRSTCLVVFGLIITVIAAWRLFA